MSNSFSINSHTQGTAYNSSVNALTYTVNDEKKQICAVHV